VELSRPGRAHCGSSEERAQTEENSSYKNHERQFIYRYSVTAGLIIQLREALPIHKGLLSRGGDVLGILYGFRMTFSASQRGKAGQLFYQVFVKFTPVTGTMQIPTFDRVDKEIALNGREQ